MFSSFGSMLACATVKISNINAKEFTNLYNSLFVLIDTSKKSHEPYLNVRLYKPDGKPAIVLRASTMDAILPLLKSCSDLLPLNATVTATSKSGQSFPEGKGLEGIDEIAAAIAAKGGKEFTPPSSDSDDSDAANNGSSGAILKMPQNFHP